MRKERPILYSTPMVQAKLEGRKTQTRRIIKESFNGCLTNGGPHPCPNDPVVIYPGEVLVQLFVKYRKQIPDFEEVCFELTKDRP